MKRNLFIVLIVLVAASFAAAQQQGPSSDVLGAHLMYGRGCAACHAPHSGVYGSGNAKTPDPTAGNSILWGEDVASLYGKTFVFAGQTTTSSTNPTTGVVTPASEEVLPTSMSATTPDVDGILTCLSCHDGNLAKGAMMKGYVYETLPSTYGPYNLVPTLLGNDGTTTGNYLNDHPVGLNTAVSCGGSHNWDCSETNGVISMTGANSSAFVKNYGFFVSLSAYNNTAVVTCTSCHNQHLMNVVNVTASNSGMAKTGFYATMFFLRGPYNPASGTAGSNQTAQFCRQCHGGEANESNGSYSIPTTF